LEKVVFDLPPSYRKLHSITYPSGTVISDSLILWNDLDAHHYTSFSGTATYQLLFETPEIKQRDGYLKSKR